MKIRQGFVSNSSSSSFVVTDERYQTTASTAGAMLRRVVVEDQEYGEIHDEHQKAIWAARNQRLENALQWCDEHPDYDNPISFPWSCNYETYIQRINNRIEVGTCNNHNWSIDIETDYLDDEYYDKSGYFLDLDSMQMVGCSYYHRKYFTGYLE